MLEISESELVLGMGLWGYPVRDMGLAGGPKRGREGLARLHGIQIRIINCVHEIERFISSLKHHLQR